MPGPLYAAASDGPTVLRTYTETTDPHRQPFPLGSGLGLIGPTAMAGLAAQLKLEQDVFQFIEAAAHRAIEACRSATSGARA